MKKETYDHITDQELIQRYLSKRDNHWLGILLERYTLLLYGVGLKYLNDEEEAKDAVQQIFLKVIQELPKYKIDYFKSWLYMVAKNYCLTVLRAKKGKAPAELTGKEDNFYEEDATETSEVPAGVLAAAIDALNKEQKECITAFYLQKKSYQDIADELGYNLLQVKSYIQNGKRNLKIFIMKKLNEMQKENG